MYHLSLVLCICVLDIAVSWRPPKYASRRKNTLNCQCGKQEEVIMRRVVGGDETKPHEFPWAVAIFAKEPEYLLCGGSLLTDRHVLSAGHCFKWDDFRNMTTFLGLHKVADTTGAERRNIRSVRIHENFTSNLIRDINDIAMLELESPVQFNSVISPVCLPEPMKEFSRRSATVVGWGSSHENATSGAQELREANVKIFRDNDCKHTKLPADYLESSMMCANAKGKDGCQGDSGGPLLIKEKMRGERFVLAGIVSWGIGCAEANLPGVYTKVSYYIDWIEKNSVGGKYCPA